ncbi:Nn.00g067440.m01.CDS01 [Neocucurbitaria sp. VM-36]
MRSYRYLFLCLSIILCLQSVAAVPHAVRRQDDNLPDQTPAPSVTGNSFLQSSVTDAASAESSNPKTESNRFSTTADVSVRSSTLSSTISKTSVTASTEPMPTISADINSENVLPIHPNLTPAMGLSGVLLILTGLVYAVIGIKNKWIYVFGSAAYLTALAVTVLIVYLMSPPVTNAIQGAFFVAAFFTGLIFGVLSLVFSDITEGFGCLLGGFCLSMWLLSLKDGGLVSSNAGRAIFIGCMSAAGYSLSFSHYTRNHGLIASIAFSGATATILGIDCLSGAGWKEFWLYLWNLNDDIFPLNTNTYPVTKNIKAELAGVVIIAAVGMVSQMRVWKLVKEHRAKSAAQQLEKQHDQDREEEALGRKIEDRFQKERAQWEVAYGGRKEQDSSIRSSTTSPKGSTSIRETEIYGYDSLEMVNMSKGGVMLSTSPDAPAGTTITVSVLKDDDIQPIDAQGNPINLKQAEPMACFEDALPKAQGNEPSIVTPPVVTAKSSLHPSAPPPPLVVPLPFMVPLEEESNSEEEDTASVSVLAETVHDAGGDRRPMSKRISDMSAMKHRISRDKSESQEDLINVPLVENDRASSVAATLDYDHDDISLRQLSPPHSPIVAEHETLRGPSSTTGEDSQTVPTIKLSRSNDAKTHAQSGGIEESTNLGVQSTAFQQLDSRESWKHKEQGYPSSNAAKDMASSQTAVRHSLTTSTDSRTYEQQEKPSSMRGAQVPSDTLVSGKIGSRDNEQLKSTKLEAPSQGLQTNYVEPPINSLRDRALPEGLSKVALSYRVNEWTKHLEAAEKPDLDELPVPMSASITREAIEEAPAPVRDEIASPLTGSRRASRRTSVEGRTPGNGGLGPDRSTSTFSQDSLMDQRTMTRSPPVASYDLRPRSNSGTRLDALSPLPGNTLMGRREALMKNRISSQSLTPHTSSANIPVDQREQENMTLAQRRQMLQHRSSMTSQNNVPPSASQNWMKKGRAAKGAPAGFDSHQPKRTSSSQSDQKREQLYAGWRDKMRDVTPPQTAAYIAEQQRVALMNERRQKEIDKQQREMIQKQQKTSTTRRPSPIARCQLSVRSAEPFALSAGLSRAHGRLVDLDLTLSSLAHGAFNTAPPRTASASSAPPPPSPVPARWSLTNRIFSLNLRSLYQGPPRLPASRLWNPVNSSPRTLAVPSPPRPVEPREDYPNLPVEERLSGARDEYPLLTLPQRRQSRQSPAPSSLAVERSAGEDSTSGRTSIGLPREPRSLQTSSQPPTPGPSTMAPHADKDIEAGIARPRHPDVSRVSLPGSRRSSLVSRRSGSAQGDDDAVSEFPWGPSHPCFPHPNPHVPLSSDLCDTTRIIRIKRDWMMKGDLAPTFANLYPEILDPLVTEDDFRILIKKINDTLTAAFDPFTFRAWLDTVMGVATLWLWDDVGLTGVKRQLAELERWIEDWNQDVGAKEAVKIIPLRRTGYLTLDIQIPDPHLGPDTASRPATQEDDVQQDALQQQDQYLPYPVTPTLQVNSQPPAIQTH